MADHDVVVVGGGGAGLRAAGAAVAGVRLSLLHWAHRFRYAVAEGLQLTQLRTPIALLCYAAALAGSAWAAVVLLG